MRQDADQGVDHGFGQGEAEQRRIDADAGRHNVRQSRAGMHHDHRLGSPNGGRGGLLEGMIERGFQGGIGWLHNTGAGDLRQQAADVFGVFSAAESLSSR